MHLNANNIIFTDTNLRTLIKLDESNTAVLLIERNVFNFYIFCSIKSENFSLDLVVLEFHVATSTLVGMPNNIQTESTYCAFQKNVNISCWETRKDLSFHNISEAEMSSNIPTKSVFYIEEVIGYILTENLIFLPTLKR